MRPYTKPITQRLRELEMGYAFTATEKSVLQRARYMISDLYELSKEPDVAYRESEINRIFSHAGLGERA